MKRKQKIAFRRFLLRLAVKSLSTFTVLTLMVILLIIIIRNNRLEVLAAELEIDSNIEVTTIETERISVKEQVYEYIDNLPMPTEENLEEIVETEIVEDVQESVTEIIKEEVVNVQENIRETNQEEIKQFSNELALIVQEKEPVIKTFNTSAYCSCEKCCDKTDAITASGKIATAWHTIAAGRDYAIGTIIYIPELSNMPNEGWFIVEDRGGAISNDRLDIYQNSHSEALQYGRKTLECYVYEF